MKSFSFFSAYLLLLTLSMTNTSCQKEYSYEGGAIPGMTAGKAVYNLESGGGGGGSCSIPLINGTYISDTVLRPSNNIQLQVSVTTTGAYTLTTNLVNNIKFSNSGIFTNTGVQTITLAGSGTPFASGVFAYTVSGSPGCTFPISVTTGLPARFTLEGSSGLCSNLAINKTYISGVPLTGDNTIEVMVYVALIGSYSINTNTVDGISFSQSGYFTATGIQKVTLKGSGTPLIPNILTFIINTGISYCAFNLTVLTPGPQAAYELESGADHTCTGYSVSGTCIAGALLTNANTMAINVTVTVPGNFTVSTNTANGMTFSYTGHFISSGSQVVILTGSGTPGSAGTFIFTPQIVGPHPTGNETCRTDITVI